MKRNKTIFVLIALTVFTLFWACKEKPSEPVYDNPLDTENTAPSASFIVNPASGTTNTSFTFDASASSDDEDLTAALQVRWDWENDGTWDTGFSATKIANHQYATEGTKTVRLEVRDSGDLTNSSTQQITVSSSNSAPVASFTVNPSSGTTLITFNFDAAASSDAEDAAAALDVRWDWENDGTWDTGYAITKTANHQYATGGTKTILLEVRDSGGLTNTTTRQVTVTVVNTAPTASFIVNPAIGTTFTPFTFDASGSSDNEDAEAILEVRWDWENDGTWDTGYSTNKTAMHEYSTTGTKTINMEVKDSENLTNSITMQLAVSDLGGETGTVTDIDGNVYQTVRIGNQWWMAENLKVIRYRNGDAIPNVTDNGDWIGLSTGAYAAYNNDNGNIATYGLLYNGFAASDIRNIAPAGWHVPTDDEWKQLEMNLGMSQAEADGNFFRGTDEGAKLKETGTTHWAFGNVASNESGFTALPAGYRSVSDGGYYAFGDQTLFWSYQDTGENAWHRFLATGSADINRFLADKLNGYSIRCVMD